MLSVFARNSGCGRAGELMRTETDSESSCAFVCCIQRSELGLLLGLGPQNYWYSSSHLDRCFPFSVGELQSWCAQIPIQKHQERSSVASR
eukprot:500298-Pyramimonas_sp.AAC.1